MTVLSMNVTNVTVLPARSRDCSCYVSRRILAHPPLLIAETQWSTRIRSRALSRLVTST